MSKRLTNTEIEALATLISGPVNEKIKKFNKTLEDKALKDWYKTKEGKVYKQFVDMFGEESLYVYKNPTKKILSNLKGIKPIISYDTIKNDLVVGLINNPDVSSLVETLKKKYDIGGSK